MRGLSISTRPCASGGAMIVRSGICASFDEFQVCGRFRVEVDSLCRGERLAVLDRLASVDDLAGVASHFG